MFQKHWNILIVDDDPDICAVSKLAMKNYEVFFLPVKLHTASSMDEAISVLEEKFVIHNGNTSSMAVAFIDVVMEEDTSGLDLCQYIREEMDNYITQLYIRTGQPGIAPERKIINDYEISGYISKVEATEDKLFTLVKSGVRQYYWSLIANWVSNSMLTLIESSGDRYKLLSAVHDTMTLLHSDDAGRPLDSVDLQLALSIEDTLVEFNMEKEKFFEERDKLLTQEPFELSDDGDVLLTDYHNLLFRIAPRKNQALIECYARGTFSVPTYLVTSLHMWLKCLSILWKISR